ncbi:PRC-barrel domain-containing protein [Dethiobacter alkaliphilus]|uniref:PRC-barrel domain-containing protein n=1 Tax=Dethiobacter alkaliphilus TaxID=427926 RepID=UPI0002FABEED|nr:PRC-barrel domain-containing protein [Dethiobacter alkaliphilus]
MKKSRDVVGLPVIELSEGKLLGRIHSLVINPATRSVAALEVGERSLLKTKTELIPFASIRSIGGDAVTLQSHDAVQQADEQPELAALMDRKIIGTKVVTVDGSLAGTVEELSFTAEDGALTEIFLLVDKTREHLALPVAVVENFGRDFIIVNADYLVQAREAEAVDTTDRMGRQIPHSLEAKAIEFVLEREAGQDVTDDDGNFIIRKGETVTIDVISHAREKNRLTQVLIAAGVSELLEGLDFTREKLDTGSKKLLESWQSLRDRSHEWLVRRLEDDRPGPTSELRELWFQLQGRLAQGGRELEDETRTKIRQYVLGKKLAHPVYDKNGILLGGRGDQVTAEMREAAENAERLPQLFLSAAAGDVQLALDPIKKQIKDVLGD